LKWSGNKEYKLITDKERRFLRQWEEQREGGKTSYVLLYTVIGTFITAIMFSVGMVIFYRIVFGSKPFWIMLACAFLFSIITSFLTWTGNEKRFRKIIRREMADPMNQ
jgi:drug/metabolite transporter (DMT)-like permease